MAGVITIKFSVMKGGMKQLDMKSPIYIPGPVEPQFGPGRYIYFEGFSVDEHGKQHYLDATVAYRQTCLRVVEYLRRFGEFAILLSAFFARILSLYSAAELSRSSLPILDSLAFWVFFWFEECSGEGALARGFIKFLFSQISFTNNITGYSDYQIYLLLSCAPVQGHVAGIVDIPNACTTIGLPMDIFDFDISPHVPAEKRDLGSCAFAGKK